MFLLSTLSVKRLMYCLQIPDSKREEIQQQCTTEKDQREKILQWYLDCSPFADFTDLAGELFFVEEKSALEQVKKYVQRVSGMRYDVCIASVVHVLQPVFLTLGMEHEQKYYSSLSVCMYMYK